MDGRSKKPEVERLLAAVRALDGTNLDRRVRSVGDAFRLLDYASQGDAAELLVGRIFTALGHWKIDLAELERKRREMQSKAKE